MGVKVLIGVQNGRNSIGSLFAALPVTEAQAFLAILHFRLHLSRYPGCQGTTVRYRLRNSHNFQLSIIKQVPSHNKAYRQPHYQIVNSPKWLAYICTDIKQDT